MDEWGVTLENMYRFTGRKWRPLAGDFSYDADFFQFYLKLMSWSVVILRSPSMHGESLIQACSKDKNALVRRSRLLVERIFPGDRDS
jgi:hypothetical protein